MHAIKKYSSLFSVSSFSGGDTIMVCVFFFWIKSFICPWSYYLKQTKGLVQHNHVMYFPLQLFIIKSGLVQHNHLMYFPLQLFIIKSTGLFNGGLVVTV